MSTDDALDTTVARIRGKLAGRRMGAPLSLREVEDLERASGVGLPEEYRRLVTEVANGGQGPPKYGLVRLGEVPEGYDRTAREQLARMGRPFPLTAYWVWEDEEPLTGERQALRERVWDGTVVLGHDGCGMYWSLVVTGPERGQIWQLTDVGAQPCAPRRGFLSWLEHWLDGHDDWWAEIPPRDRG